MFACDPKFKKYLDKRCVVILRKLKNNENPFNIEKYIPISRSDELDELDESDELDHSELTANNNYNNRLSQVKIIGTLQSISKENGDYKKLRTVSIKPDDNLQSSHIITSDIDNFALFIDNSDELKSNTIYAFSSLEKRLQQDNLYEISLFLCHEYIQINLN